MKVKICGLRRTSDTGYAIELGATHLGLVLAQDSPRCATIREAQAIVRCARGRARVVLVFRNERTAVIVRQATELGVKLVQVHGADTQRRRELGDAGLSVIPVASVAPDADSLPVFAESPNVLLPALLDVGRGGTGRCFHWDLLAPEAPANTFVAGGITPANVTELMQYRPWGIDVSSGVELAPGIKSPGLLRRLFCAVRALGEVA